KLDAFQTLLALEAKMIEADGWIKNYCSQMCLFESYVNYMGDHNQLSKAAIRLYSQVTKTPIHFWQADPSGVLVQSEKIEIETEIPAIDMLENSQTGQVYPLIASQLPGLEDIPLEQDFVMLESDKVHQT